MEIIHSIEKWFEEHGYLLEMSVADIFRKYDFGVLQSHEYLTENGTNREIDVVADVRIDQGRASISSTFLVECKQSKEKPWIGFTHKYQAKTQSQFEPYIRYFRDDMAYNSITGIIPGGDRGSFTRIYGLTVSLRGKSDNKDTTYDAIMSVETALATAAKNWQSPNGSGLIFPIVVVRGGLYTAHLDNGVPVILESDGFLLKGKSSGIGSKYDVLITNESGLEKFIDTHSSLIIDLMRKNKNKWGSTNSLDSEIVEE